MPFQMLLALPVPPARVMGNTAPAFGREMGLDWKLDRPDWRGNARNGRSESPPLSTRRH